MAKKNLHSLMSGIIGDSPSSPSIDPPNPQIESPAPASKHPDPQPSRKGPGRPRKTDENDNTRATFIVSAEMLRKIKYISLMDDRLQSDVVGEALSLYVSKWEHDNGKIKLPKK